MTGVVKDVMGEPLIGANVVEKGRSTNGVITDFNGKFTLEVDESASLVVSYIGYLAQDIPTKGKGDFHIILKEDTNTLDEVVVTGTRHQTDIRHLSQTVSVVNRKRIEQSMQPSLLPVLTASVWLPVLLRSPVRKQLYGYGELLP